MMKLEIEITEDEIRSALERKIRVAIADQTNFYGSEQEIKETVRKLWRETMTKMVEEELSNLEPLREKVQKSIEAKIMRQLQALTRSNK